MLEAAGNDRLVNVGDASSHIVIFPDHSITELEVFFPETILSSTKYTPFVMVTHYVLYLSMRQGNFLKYFLFCGILLVLVAGIR